MRVRAARPLTVLLLAAGFAAAQEAALDFRQNCASCHTVGGGRLTGPDLKGVLDRRDRDWLVRFIVDPAAMLDSGDAYAAKLLEEARGVRMPNIAGMGKARAEALVDLIDAEGKLEKSQFAGVQIPDRPFTPADIERGRAIFRGASPLRAGGPSCLGCHAIGGIGGLGGGRLGPDLTKVFERYEDRRKLGAWLSAPATPTMGPTFRVRPLDAEEILPLIAYFEDAARREEEDRAPRALVFALLGLGGAAGCFVLFQRLWSGRFLGVRRPLVERAALPTGGREKPA